MKNFIIAILVLILLGIGGYYYYTNYYLQDDFESNEISTKIEPQTDISDINSINNEVSLSEKEKVKLFLDDFFDRTYLLDGSLLFSTVRYGLIDEGYDVFLDETINKTRKNVGKLEEFINNYKQDFFDLVSPRTYRISNMDNIVTGLLLSYNDLYTDEANTDKNLKSIFKLMNTDDDKLIKIYFKDIEKYMSQQSSQAFENIRNSNGSIFSDSDIVWFYSFWARRYNERNSKQAIDIILEIDQHYNPDSEPTSDE